MDPLFSFRELDDSVRTRLERALTELPEVHTSSSANRDFLDSPVLDRGACLSMVLAAIGKDYAVNIRQEPREPWVFDYVVELTGTTLNVMTRLSAKADDSKGSIFYGASIVRVGPDRYATRSDFG